MDHFLSGLMFALIISAASVIVTEAAIEAGKVFNIDTCAIDYDCENFQPSKQPWGNVQNGN